METRRSVGTLSGEGIALDDVFSTAITLGISSGLATNLYFILQRVSWAGLAVSIVAGIGIGAAAGAAIYAAVKRIALKKILKW